MGRRRKSSVTLSTVRALSQVPTETLGLPGDPARPGDPTPERLQRAGYTVAMQLGTGNIQVIGAPRPVIGFDGIVRVSQAQLDRLAARTQLDPNAERNDVLFQAGDKLRDHHHLAGLSGFAANDLLGSTGGGHPSSRTPITETMERHRRALRAAQAATDPRDWAAVSAVVIEERTLEEAGRETGFGNRAGAQAVALDRLRRGLGALAELWGYLPPERPDLASVPAANDDAAAVQPERAVG